ncbi:MAG: SDR family NAD(P)-dependent oxidoreductase, partial [Acidobacteriota bacterium]
MRRVLVLGATSPIAKALCRELAQQGDTLFLAARPAPQQLAGRPRNSSSHSERDDLQALAADLRVRYQATVHTGCVDAQQRDTHPAFFEKALQALGGLDGVIVTIGALGDQPADSYDHQAASRLIDVNFSGPSSLLALCANQLEKQGAGFLLAYSSVAGDRGRQSNYAYGAAKAGLNVFLQGLRHRLGPCGVRVITIKLGFVDTEMTWGLPGLFLVASPQQIARKTLRTLKGPGRTYYLPGFWRFILFVLRNLPERVF